MQRVQTPNAFYKMCPTRRYCVQFTLISNVINEHPKVSFTQFIQNAKLHFKWEVDATHLIKYAMKKKV